jgi:hypothetical protein
MKTVVAALDPPASEGHTPHATGASAVWLTTKPVQELKAANRRIRFDFMTSIWCGAMVGCIGAAVFPPFPESR